MKRNPLRHQMISASAGSGKTFQLVNRYLQLLINYQVPPEGIVALTFSRKAAGEIFDAIIQRLAEAIASDHKQKELGYHIENERIDRQQLIELLRTLIHRLHRLRISTYDSFFSWILKTFPLEFGMSGGFEILTPEQEHLVTRRIITQALSDSVADSSSQSAFFAAFKQATFGKEEKRLESLLHEFITTYHDEYLDIPSRSRWGNLENIWPAGCRWFKTKPNLKMLACDLKTILASETLTDKQFDKWQLFLEEVARFSGDVVTENLNYLLVKLIGVLDDLSQGQAEITVFKKQHLSSTICASASQIVEGIIRCILEAKLQKTQGIFRILEHYEQLYDRLVRRSGTLSFDDIEYMLGPGPKREGNRVLTQEQTAGIRLYIGYRLDSRFDHWLLDEFQDTSNRQWQILANLVDEVVQDASGTRSFFYVGDIKQAIHGWRGGDMDLFNRLYDFYNQDGEHIYRKPLVTSFRSASEIIDTVNRVFCLENLEILPTSVVARWKKSWCEHTTARGEMEGFVGLINAPKRLDSDQRNLDPCGEVLVNIIEALPYRSTELSTAVLVRSNRRGRAITNLLRGHHIHCTWEGDTGLVDNPLTTALLSLLKLAQHPGDRYAWQHISMTPLKDCMDQLKLNFPDLVLLINRQLHRYGVAFTMDYWYRHLQSRITTSEFGQYRMKRLLEVARIFDDSGNRNVLEFIDFLKSFSVVDGNEAGCVRVMTIHKSKGLGFDIVLLPDLQFGGITSCGKLDLGVQRQQGITAKATWVLSMPPREIAKADSVLSDYIAHADSNHCYEELCLLYVAMTRAKRCLYMITSQQSSRSNAVHYSTLIKNALCCQVTVEDAADSDLEYLYQSGNPNWHAQVLNSAKTAHPTKETQPNPPPSSKLTGAEPMRHLKPSGLEQRVLFAGQLFSLSNRDAAGTGSAVHSLFEQIEWLDTMDIEQLLITWNDSCMFQPAIATIACDEFRAAIQRPTIKNLMQRPKEQEVEVWREKRFEIVLDNHFISGSFDRVVLIKGPAQQIKAASIIDFKTDRIDPCGDHNYHVAIYKPQLDLYRRVLSVMLNLPKAKISCHLVFTKIDVVIDLYPKP